MTAGSCRGCTPPARRPASAVAECTAIARWKGHSWAAACFPGAMPGARRRRQRDRMREMRASGLAAVLAIIGWVNPALSETIDINGIARSYTIQLPDKNPAPLVIVL